MALWIILIFSSYGCIHGQEPPLYSGNRAEQQSPSVQDCCEDGRDRALGGKDCTILPLISSTQICRIAQEQCCAELAEKHLCTNGINMAREQGVCERPFFEGEPWETFISNMCCDCCTLGLMAADSGLSCELEGVFLGKQCEHAAKTCCSQNYTTEEPQPPTQDPVEEDPPVTVTVKPEEGEHDCRESNCSQLCVDGRCACHDGYQLKVDGVTCDDVNECLIGSHTCLPGQVCINTEGSFRCQRETSCGTGYELTDHNDCQDIDECALGTHNCGQDSACTNTPGSFRCHPRESCGVGYIQDAVGSCIDINECEAPTGPCLPGQTCVNTVGSYTCSYTNTVTCEGGYHLTEDGARCEDVNECLIGSHTCLPGQVCINTEGSFRCQRETSCGTGYELTDHNDCQDIDECALGTHNCGQDSACTNTPGSFRCHPRESCGVGYIQDAVGSCIDINECEAPTGPCLPGQTCVNTVGSYSCSMNTVTCEGGYHLTEDGARCEDVNECLIGSHTCLPGQVCINTEGSFRCQRESSCGTGYELTDHNDCQDIDECALGTHNCGQDSACTNTPGSFRCHPRESCGVGYIQDAVGSCIDINECEAPTGPCLPGQTCVNTVGSYTCNMNTVTCGRGHHLTADGARCEDVNECLIGSHNCLPGQVCINTEGSFRCQRETSCGTGYELTDHNDCQDIDECALGTHNCGQDFACTNTPGSFRCHPRESCGVGYLQDAVGSCIDINECVAPPGPCLPGQTCVNTVGSYSCRMNTVTCGRGYHLTADGARCEDVDECRGSGACGGHACVNMVGTYRCECRIGFIFNSIAKLCEDINECRHYPGRLCAHRCENTEGSYLCSCTTGFKLSHDGRNCEDVNECETKPCSQECANVYGSYQCYCRRGYQLSDIDGITCEDIDECALPTGGHVCSYRCTNAPGSFYCTCPPVGYTLAPNGRTCQDIDECSLGTHSCSVSESCFNVQGGFRCLPLDCPLNFRRAAEGRCERVTCEFTPDPPSCFSLPLRISYYNVTFPTNTPVPADVFRMGPSNSAPGDDMLLDIVSGDEEGYFGTQRLAHGGVISLRRALTQPRDFLLTVEMRLIRYGTVNLFMAKIAVSRTDSSVSLRCIKSCKPNDVGCAADNVHLITHIVISLPTFREFSALEEIVFLRTSVPATPGLLSGAPGHLSGATDVLFDIVAADDQFSFDVVKRFHHNTIMGIIRQVKPIVGPRDLTVEVAMNYIKSGLISHCNVVVIHVYISEFWF